MAITSIVGIQTAAKQSFVITATGNASGLDSPRNNWTSNNLVPANVTRFSPDNTNGLQFKNPIAGQNTYLSDTNIYGVSTSPYYTLIVDVIWGVVVTNTTTLQTLSSPLMGNRDINGTTRGDGVYLILVNGTGNLGGGTCFLTVTYTSSDGNTGRIGLSGNAGNFQGGRTTFISLANGDKGVQSVQSAQWSALPGGGLNLYAYRPIAIIPGGMARSDGTAAGDALNLALPQIYDNSCIQFLYGNGAGTRGQISLIQG